MSVGAAGKMGPVPGVCAAAGAVRPEGRSGGA